MDTEPVLVDPASVDGHEDLEDREEQELGQEPDQELQQTNRGHESKGFLLRGV